MSKTKHPNEELTSFNEEALDPEELQDEDLEEASGGGAPACRALISCGVYGTLPDVGGN